MISFIKTAGRLAGWRLCISNFEFSVVYGADIKHRDADAVSSLLTKEEEWTLLSEELTLCAIDTEIDDSSHGILLTDDRISPYVARGASSENSPQTVNVFFLYQVHVSYYMTTTLHVDHINEKFHINHNGLLVWKSILHEATKIVLCL